MPQFHTWQLLSSYVPSESVTGLTQKILQYLNLFISSMRQDAVSIKSEKTTQHGFSPDGGNF